MSIKILSAGLATTVQDLGRPGYYHLGIPLSGGMDRYALQAANMLVGNDVGAAVLEAVFMGPELEFTEDAVVGITGADMPIKVDGNARESDTSFVIKKGQTLSFDYLRAGARIYIAVAGGIDVPVVLGSRSTYALGALGGYGGRPLASGDMLDIGKGMHASTSSQSFEKKIPEHFKINLKRTLSPPVELHMVPDIYWYRLTETAQQNFLNDTWKVAPEADRIGYRFRGGQPLEFVERKQPFGAGSDPSNIVDGCYPYGSIQVPGGTEPIVLHRDAVSGGGYFMVGTVVSADMDVIGQMQPNMPARFVAIDVKQALELRRARRASLEALQAALQ